MTSQISFAKLLKEDFRHRRWMLILSIAIQMVFGPVIVLMAMASEYLSMRTTNNYETLFSYSNYFVDENFEVKFFRSFENIATYDIIVAGTAIAIVGAIIVGVAGFSYFFSKRKMDMYGSIPVTRTELFLATYLNGVIVWVIPFVASNLLIILIGVSIFAKYGMAGAAIMVVLKVFGWVALEFLAAYHVVLLAVSLSGTGFVAIVNSVMLGVDVAALYLGIAYYIESTRCTMLVNPFTAEKMIWLAPFVSAPAAYSVHNQSIAKAIVIIVGTIVLAAVNFFLAAKLFKRRKSELAENGVDNKPYLYVIRILTTLAIGIFNALCFSIVGGTGSVWNYFGLVVGCVATFGVVNMILHKSGKAFFKDWPIMIGTTVVSILLLVGVIYDFVGYDRYVPNKNNIESADIYLQRYCDDSAYYMYRESNMYSYGLSYLGYYTCTDVDLIHELCSVGSVNSIENQKIHGGDYTSIFYSGYETTDDVYGYSHQLSYMYVAIHLKNGKTVYRQYQMYEYDVDLLEKIVNSDEYKDAYYAASTGCIGYPAAIRNYEVDDWYSSNSLIYDEEYIKLIMDAYWADFAEMENLVEDYDYSYKYSISVCYSLDGYGDATISLPLYDSFERSMWLDEYFTVAGITPETVKEARETLEEAGLL